jgi:N-methylhydantoinase B
MLSSALFQTQIERTLCPPWGLMGGMAAEPNRITVTHANGINERFPTGKVAPMRLEPGDGYITETGGGGGFWSPLDRDPQQVLADVRSGYVSAESAERDYGVVVRGRERAFELDAMATESLRRQRLEANEEDGR